MAVVTCLALTWVRGVTKTNGTISNESIHKDTSLPRNIVNMRNREDVVTSNPKEDEVKLNKLT